MQKKKEESKLNYCYHCISYDCDYDEDGSEFECCKKDIPQFKKGSDKINCSTFTEIIERCEVCGNEKPITEFYNDGFPLVCSIECSSKLLRQLEVENEMLIWQKENL